MFKESLTSNVLKDELSQYLVTTEKNKEIRP